MLRNKYLKIFFSITVAISLYACSNTSDYVEENSVLITDMLGREVYVPAKVERIIGLRAGALRLLTYMGAADMIAGIEEIEKRDLKPYIKAYPELLNREIIGPAMGGDAELILKAKPDLIFITYTTTEDADALQRKTGIPVVALECKDLGIGTDNRTLFDAFRLIGKIINNDKRADSLISYINTSIDELNNRTASIYKTKRPSVYVGGLSYSNSYGISATHPEFAPFSFINAKNVASEIDKRLRSHVKGTFVDVEQIILWNPDYLFIDESGLQLVINDMKNSRALNFGLDAFKNDKVFILLRYNNYATNYEYVLLNAWYAGKVLYPDFFEDINIETKASEVLSAFYGKELNAEFFLTSSALNNLSKIEL